MLKHRVPLGDSPPLPSLESMEGLLRGAAGSPICVETFKTAFAGCDGTGKSSADTLRTFFAGTSLRDGQQARVAKQAGIDYKRLRDDLKHCEDSEQRARMLHDLDVLDKKRDRTPKFGAFAARAKADAKKDSKEEDKKAAEEAETKHKAALKGANWKYSGSAKVLAERWARLQEGKPMEGDLTKRKRKQAEEEEVEPEEVEPEEVEPEGEDAGITFTDCCVFQSLTAVHLLTVVVYLLTAAYLLTAVYLLTVVHLLTVVCLLTA